MPIWMKSNLKSVYIKCIQHFAIKANVIKLTDWCTLLLESVVVIIKVKENANRGMYVLMRALRERCNKRTNTWTAVHGLYEHKNPNYNKIPNCINAQ